MRGSTKYDEQAEQLISEDEQNAKSNILTQIALQ